MEFVGVGVWTLGFGGGCGVRAGLRDGGVGEL